MFIVVKITEFYLVVVTQSLYNDIFLSLGVLIGLQPILPSFLVPMGFLLEPKVVSCFPYYLERMRRVIGEMRKGNAQTGWGNGVREVMGGGGGGGGVT